MRKLEKLTKVDVVDIQLNGWNIYDLLGLDQKAELCIEVAGRLAEGECDIRMKVFDTAVACLDEAKPIKPSSRWVYGSRDKKWHLVGPDDRDYVTGTEVEIWGEAVR